MRDMFEHYEELPEEVKEVLAEFEAMENDYESCANLVASLNAIGWTCEYYLQAEPFNLRPLSEYDNWENEMVDKIFEMCMDDMHPLDSVHIRREVRTRDEKIIYFIERDEKLKKYLDN